VNPADSAIAHRDLRKAAVRANRVPPRMEIRNAGEARRFDQSSRSVWIWLQKEFDWPVHFLSLYPVL